MAVLAQAQRRVPTEPMSAMARKLAGLADDAAHLPIHLWLTSNGCDFTDGRLTLRGELHV